jgi:hypothetical protein
MANCPYLEMNLPRCGGSLNLQHLDEAFNLCVDHFELCPLNIEMSLSAAEAAGRTNALVIADRS